LVHEVLRDIDLLFIENVGNLVCPRHPAWNSQPAAPRMTIRLRCMRTGFRPILRS
jgi:hypothetical protein